MLGDSAQELLVRVWGGVDQLINQPASTDVQDQRLRAHGTKYVRSTSSELRGYLPCLSRQGSGLRISMAYVPALSNDHLRP